ncbi:MAG TPA: sortase [Candidatus Woesebacteria bacterium]|nr:sortase [Candidatus Woesebacteria bacterium]
MLYGYKKATAKNPHPGRRIPLYLKTVPTLISALGLGILGAVAYPVVSYQLKTLKPSQSNDSGLLSPVYYETKASSDQEPKVLTDLDYTKASTWFPGSGQNNLFAANQKEYNPDIPDTYLISIPSLGLTDAEVALFDEDLTKHLVQYPQTALPGQSGSPVIFGHSTLPQFYDSKKYTTIFSNLTKLKVGSDIIVKYVDKEYTYRVTNTIEVKPSELWVLKQNYSSKTIKVITCVPPGTTLRRLVVEGTLISD